MDVLLSNNVRENEYLNAAFNYLKAKKFPQCRDLTSKLIAKNPSLSVAYWFRLLADLKFVDGNDFTVFFNQEELNKKVLSTSDFKSAIETGSPEQKAYYFDFINRLKDKWAEIQKNKETYEEAYYQYLKKEFAKFPYNKRRRFFYRVIDPLANNSLDIFDIIYYILGGVASYYTFSAIALVAGDGILGLWFFLIPVFYYLVKLFVFALSAVIFFPIKMVKKKTAKIQSYEEFVHQVNYVKTNFNFELIKLDRAVKFYLNREQIKAGDIL